MPARLTADEDLLGVEDGESWSDDPVRMYLTQMGEIPLADASGGDSTRQEDRSDASPFSQHAAGMRLCDSSRLQDSQARPSRGAALRPHRAGLCDRSPGEGSDSGAAAAQSGDAGCSAATQSSRLSHCLEQVADRSQSPPRLASAWPTPPPCRAVGRRTWVCGRSGSNR